jgi:holo-[acyl-carrier protein] synthase
MIVGIGTDMVDTRRIEKLLHRFGDRFVCKIFTPQERVYCMAQHHPAAAFAKRFAAKEAALKALGTGLRAGITWHDIEIFNDTKGKPCLRIAEHVLVNTVLLNASSDKISDAFPPIGNRPRKQLYRDALDIHVSLADEQPYALAFVVISKTI